MIAYHHVVDRDLANTQCHDLAQVRFKHQSIRCHLIPRQFLEERFHAHAAVYAAPSSTCISGSGFLSMCYRLADGATVERHENNSHDHQNNSHKEEFPSLRDRTIVSGIALIDGLAERRPMRRPIGTSYSNGATVRGSDDYDALRLDCA